MEMIINDKVYKKIDSEFSNISTNLKNSMKGNGSDIIKAGLSDVEEFDKMVMDVKSKIEQIHQDMFEFEINMEKKERLFFLKNNLKNDLEQINNKSMLYIQGIGVKKSDEIIKDIKEKEKSIGEKYEEISKICDNKSIELNKIINEYCLLFRKNYNKLELLLNQLKDLEKTDNSLKTIVKNLEKYISLFDDINEIVEKKYKIITDIKFIEDIETLEKDWYVVRKQISDGYEKEPFDFNFGLKNKKKYLCYTYKDVDKEGVVDIILTVSEKNRDRSYTKVGDIISPTSKKYELYIKKDSISNIEKNAISDVSIISSNKETQLGYKCTRLFDGLNDCIIDDGIEKTKIIYKGGIEKNKYNSVIAVFFDEENYNGNRLLCSQMGNITDYLKENQEKYGCKSVMVYGDNQLVIGEFDIEANNKLKYVDKQKAIKVFGNIPQLKKIEKLDCVKFFLRKLSEDEEIIEQLEKKRKEEEERKRKEEEERKRKEEEERRIRRINSIYATTFSYRADCKNLKTGNMIRKKQAEVSNVIDNEMLSCIYISVSQTQYGNIKAMGHISNIGDRDGSTNGNEISIGVTNFSNYLEGLSIKLEGELKDYFSLSYIVMPRSWNTPWTQWCNEGDFVGSRGCSNYLLGFQLIVRCKCYKKGTEVCNKQRCTLYGTEYCTNGILKAGKCSKGGSVSCNKDKCALFGTVLCQKGVIKGDIKENKWEKCAYEGCYSSKCNEKSCTIFGTAQCRRAIPTLGKCPKGYTQYCRSGNCSIFGTPKCVAGIIRNR